MSFAVSGKREIVSRNRSRVRAPDGFPRIEGPPRYLLALPPWASYPLSPCFHPLVCEVEIKGRDGGVVPLSGLTKRTHAGHLRPCPAQPEESPLAFSITRALCTGLGTFV